MNDKLQKIHEYLKSKGVDEETLNYYDKHCVYLSMEIMEYAHRDQKRENGEEYANHPSRVLQKYRDLVGMDPNDCFCIDVDLMHKHKIPYEGVQEVCLLDDVRDIFVECGFKDFFDMYIKNALECITHEKSEKYGKYIGICLENPISAMVKMCDMQDNLHVLDLLYFDEDRFKRAQSYLGYLYIINQAYHFIENAAKYRKEFKE